MLVRPSSVQVFAAQEAGGKGYNLYRMSKLGLAVPNWTVIGRSVFDTFLATSGIRTEIESLLGGLSRHELNAATVSARIEALIMQTPLTPQVLSLAKDAYLEVFGGGLISVRSSAADEDGAGHSFAGQLSSFLYVASFEDALVCLQRAWASGFSERGLSYRLEKDISLHAVSVAVVFQAMIDPDQSGVLFTCDPTTQDMQSFMISAVYGVGEGLVSGALDADTYWLDAASGVLVKEDIVDKEKAMRRAGSAGTELAKQEGLASPSPADQSQDHYCKEVPVDASLRLVPCLSAAMLSELYQLGKLLKQHYGKAQDIEWAIQDGKVYLLQTRPVTNLAINDAGYPNLWDNSNIVESYGGLTSPLSFTFALRNYRNVYIQFCEILGVPQPVVKDMESYLGYMLGIVNGRVFYNLFNWYKLVGVLPGFSNNRQFMETMMGVGEELTDETRERIKPHASWDTWRGKLRRIRTGLAFIYYHFTIQSMVDRFHKDFHRDYDLFRRLPYELMSSDQIYHKYLEMDRVMLGKWQSPIINDFLCMVHFGVLKKLTAKWLGHLEGGIQNDLLAGEGNLESAEPTKTLIRMAGEVASDPSLRQLIEERPADELLEALNQSPHQAFYAKVQDYIDRYGFRCMSEMKLEEKDLLTEPSFLFICLKNYLRSGTTDLEVYESREKQLRSKAEQKVGEALSGLKKLTYLWSLKHARKAVKNRENTRFARTRAYGVARQMFRAMGKELVQLGTIKQPEDVFFLTLEEIHGIHQGTLPSLSLAQTAEMRRSEYATFEAMEPKIRFMTRGPVYWQNSFLAEVEEPEVEEGASYHLRGLPCCPGIVEGTVKVVSSPSDDLNLNGEILVASRTDPGWVPLYPSISGLLVERGSLLSHSAIVAREMGLPTIVGIKALSSTLKTGMRVRIDGAKGTITILAG